MDWIALISIIVTVIGSGIALYSIFSDKRKSRKEREQVKIFLKSRETLPLNNWANQTNIEFEFIELIKRLVFAADFKSKVENVMFADLLIQSSDNNSEYIPNGKSIWEIKSSSPSKKLLEDLEKKCSSLKDLNKSQIILIYATPFFIEQKNDWLKQWKNRGWKEIRIYDAEIITTWLEKEPSVSLWFELKHLGNFPTDGIVLPEDFWEEWSTGPNLKLDSSIILGGRENERNEILNLITLSNIIAIQGTSREEVIAFIISSLMVDDNIKDTFLRKCFIIDNQNAFRKLIEINDKLILIPRFDDYSILNLGLKSGHTILAPIGLDDTNNWNQKITLSSLDREKFIHALVNSGCSEETAKRISKESNRNITILRRQLGFNRTIPSWTNSENIKEIIPALIVGRWNGDSEKDKSLIANISGYSYEDFIFKLNKWLVVSDSPIVRIGNSWRLTSPLDAWTNGSRFLLNFDFEKLYAAFIEVLSEKDVSLEIPQQQRLFTPSNKAIVFSSWIKDGIIQSLTIIAVFGDKLKLDLQISSQLWVDNIITKLLELSDSALWKSFERLLPQIAEASPNGFLTSIEKHLNDNDNVINSLFIEEDGFITPRSYHTGLLWGLENVAWLPEYFSRTILVLVKLSVIDPGIKILNRPINSLVEIFKPWHFQTLANFHERMDVLKLIANSEKQIAWELLCKLLPDNHSVGFPTHTMRWRLFDENLQKPKTYQEIWDTHSTIVDILLSSFEINEYRFSQLIEKSVNLSMSDRDKVLSSLESKIKDLKQIDFVAWHSTRKILSQHRSHPKTEWALPESILQKYERIYNELMPKDEIIQTTWLFDDYHPKFVEGIIYPDVPFDEEEKIIQKKRFDVLTKLYLQYGIDRIIEISSNIKQPGIYGDTLARIIEDDKIVIKLCALLNSENNKLVFIQSFLYRKCIVKGIDWTFTIYDHLDSLNFTYKSLAIFLLSVIQNRVIWEKIETLNSLIQEYYWINLKPRFHNLQENDLEYGIKNLINYKRFFTALEISSHIPEKLQSDLLIDVLEKSATQIGSEEIRIDGYEVNRVFEVLDSRKDIDRSKMIQLEWYYLPILASYGNPRNPKILHEELAINPDFFIEVIKSFYKSKDEALNIKERDGLTDEQIQTRAKHVYELLNSWKTIPGVNENGEINTEELNSWIHKVRELAIETDRLEVVDIQIGKLLAQYPENNKIWPPKEICQVIESINTDSLISNFSSATFNKRGFSTRGAFEGGDIERGHAEYFENLAKLQRSKFPIVASILSNLARGYREDAKRMDVRAEKDKLDY
jgi:hypothetical protein